jgi:hypothetical protein
MKPTLHCPKYHDHGPVVVRLLLPGEVEQELDSSEADDVYEVRCPVCGKYEMREDELQSRA